MIRIEEVATQTLYKRLGDTVTVSVKLHNYGNATGNVRLYVEVYEPVNNIWTRITDRVQGDDVSVSPGSTVTKSYSFKPFSILEGLFVVAKITGDSSDQYSDYFDFSFTDYPEVKWYSGYGTEFKVIENWPNTCSGSVTEKHSFHYGETVRLMYRAFNFENHSTVRVLFTCLKEITSDVYWLKWQGVLSINPPSPGYYFLCVYRGWNLSNWVKGIYLTYATAEMFPGSTYGVEILDNYFNIY